MEDLGGMWEEGRRCGTSCPGFAVPSCISWKVLVNSPMKSCFPLES